MDKLPAKIKKMLAESDFPNKPDLEQELLKQLNSSIKRQSSKFRREAEFNRRLNKEMMVGLQNIYKEIAKLTASPGNSAKARPEDQESASEIFREASRQLEEIMHSTLHAADKIMDSSETIQTNQQTVANKLEAMLGQPGGKELPEIMELCVLLEQNREAVTSIVMALSFQDLTGQRIKKVVQALGSIHSIVVQTYLSAGLMLKKSEADEELDFDTLEAESRREAEAQFKGEVKNSQLIGPDGKADQNDVDDLLAQLGL